MASPAPHTPIDRIRRRDTIASEGSTKTKVTARKFKRLRSGKIDLAPEKPSTPEPEAAPCEPTTKPKATAAKAKAKQAACKSKASKGTNQNGPTGTANETAEEGRDEEDKHKQGKKTKRDKQSKQAKQNKPQEQLDTSGAPSKASKKRPAQEEQQSAPETAVKQESKAPAKRIREKSSGCAPDVKQDASTPARAEHAQTSQDVAAQLRRSTTTDMTPADPSTPASDPNTGEHDEKTTEPERKNKERTPEQKAIHARFMRFSRSLQSPRLNSMKLYMSHIEFA